jgi:hypothetical protein
MPKGRATKHQQLVPADHISLSGQHRFAVLLQVCSRTIAGRTRIFYHIVGQEGLWEASLNIQPRLAYSVPEELKEGTVNCCFADAPVACGKGF